MISTILLFDTSKTIAKRLVDSYEMPWEILPKIKDFIIELGEKLPKDRYEQISPCVWAAKSAIISPTAHIGSPCIIDENAEIRHCAFIRGSAVIGKKAVIGNSTELKNCILFDEVQVPHFNYIGDSILGYKSHLGAGAITSNVKSDKSLVTVKCNDGIIETGLKKLGALVGDFTEVGCNSVLNPGTVLGQNCSVYPTSCVRGYIHQNSIFKNDGTVISKV